MPVRLVQRTLEALRSLRAGALAEANAALSAAEKSVARHEDQLRALRSKLERMPQLVVTFPKGLTRASRLQQAEANRRHRHAQRQTLQAAAQQAAWDLRLAHDNLAQARTRVETAVSALRPVEERLHQEALAERRAATQRWDDEQDELLSIPRDRGEHSP